MDETPAIGAPTVRHCAVQRGQTRSFDRKPEQENPVPVQPFVKSAVYTTAHISGLSRALSLRYRGRGIIFALHSITDDDAFHPDHTLRCPAGKLEWILRRLRDSGVDFVSLDGAVERLGSASTRPFAAFAFDDGYADNLTRALPIMERFAAPFTVYVTTGMVTREIDAWWFGLAALIRKHDHVALPEIGFDLACADPALKRQAYSTLETAIHRNFDLLPAVRRAIKSAGIDIRAEVDKEALTEQQLRILSRHPLVSIGGHTTTHLNLARASAALVRSEMLDNLNYLREVTGVPVIHNAYPFGHSGACGEREADISRSLGFRTSVTTRAGMLFPQHLDHLHALPRVCLSRNENASTLHCKLNGLSRAINSRFGDPVARM
jgi:peptidoglycan/xylan/chitin deacetylase (PgdA/CDA1 family)